MNASPDNLDIQEICKKNGFSYEPFRKKTKAEKKQKRDYYCELGEESRICGKTVIVLECKKGLHDYGKRVYCGREWCCNCGKDKSDAHKRRYARLLPKVFYLGESGKGHGLGYWIFTMPLNVRDSFKSKKRLQNAGRFCRGLLRKYGFRIGVSRWHFFGDGQIFEGELDLGKYHPHLNALVAGRWVSDKEMGSIKEQWRSYLSRVSGQPVEVVDVWFHYFKDRGEWWHKAKYITRPTFKSLDGHVTLAKTLFAFRNVVYWGWGKKSDREVKEEKGRLALKSWLGSLPPNDGDCNIASEQAVDLSLLTAFLCPSCSLEGYEVKLQCKLDLDSATPIVLALDSLKEYIKRDYGGGFFGLSPMTPKVILSLKPMSCDLFDASVYDTS